MEVKKNINGYTIEVDFEEYDNMMHALREAVEYWENYSGIQVASVKYEPMLEEMQKAKKRYLTDEETAQIRDCLCCKHCLPPYQRENGRMCKLNECKFEEA